MSDLQHFTSHDGTDIAYLDTGGAGQLVFLLHGFAAEHHGNWVMPGVVTALSGAGYRVIAPDARGHGHSGKPHDPAAYSGDAMVNDTRALMDHLGADQPRTVHVAGYSMGSLLSARLVPLEPRARSLILGGVGGRLGEQRRSAFAPAVAAALEAPDPDSISNPVARAFRDFADSTGADKLALAALQRSEPGPPAELEKIAVPTLVLTGDGDVLVGPPDALAAHIPGATFKLLSGDHLTAVNDPAFPASIVEFIQSVG